ncbi:MaoC family dehydratase [Specibacter cremeus]|uniref:MaoC family dehydratase n=1 Tax=Specibacter cremeus TaxID=1629051 RepID=UPI001F0BBBEF|nr:MaoC family dehydratase [Specibacter cremeus]
MSAGGGRPAAGPSLSKLYVNAVAMAAKARLLRTAPVLTLPSRAAEVTGIRADPAKLTEFQHLMGQPARDVLPSGYVHALAFPVAMSVMVDDEFPLPLLGMIHLRNEVEHLAPIQYRQPLAVRAWARNLAGHRAGTQVEIVAEVRAAPDPAVVWRGVSTYLARGVFLPGLDKPGLDKHGLDRPATASAREGFDPPAATARWRLGVDTGRAYAAVSGDFNPIHLSVLSARMLGMRRSIAHGMYAASRVIEGIGSPKPDAFAWDISFGAPIFLPATVSLCVTDRSDDGGGWAGAGFVGWNASSARQHFSGSVRVLPA